jgi:sarcosine/dimethylglycine N-methyltransferase
MAAALGLSATDRFLDIGAGSGWPGLFMASRTGSRSVLLDLPLNALQKARRRAVRDGMDARIEVIAASGAALPFADASFDAISHSDVLCCLPEKTAMLRECRRVATAGARMVFAVIYIAPGLGDRAVERTLEAGPPFLEAAGRYEEMLSTSGWQLLESSDVTDEYARSVEALADGLSSSTELRNQLGDAAFGEAIDRRREQVEVIRAGYMKREIFDCH